MVAYIDDFKLMMLVALVSLPLLLLLRETGRARVCLLPQLHRQRPTISHRPAVSLGSRPTPPHKS